MIHFFASVKERLRKSQNSKLLYLFNITNLFFNLHVFYTYWLISDTAFTNVSGACGAIDAPGQNLVAKTLSLPFALELGGPGYIFINFGVMNFLNFVFSVFSLFF